MRGRWMVLAALGIWPSVGRGQAAVAFRPVIGQVPDGVMLDVTPVVSADRRYVRMTLYPQFNAFERFDSFSIPAIVSGRGNGGFGGGGVGGGLNSIGPMAADGLPSLVGVIRQVAPPRRGRGPVKGR